MTDDKEPDNCIHLTRREVTNQCFVFWVQRPTFILIIAMTARLPTVIPRTKIIAPKRQKLQPY